MNTLANKASILAIGTELTTGQIINRNAAWISEKLVELGADIVLHETVADDRAAIALALDRCSSVSQLIFVCGGLGPTTDDFTRDCIAAWLKVPLEYYAPTWTKIENRLTRLGVPVASSNKQQAYYPLGSTVLTNPQGTADGFECRHLELKLWVLPGPPREIEAIWSENHLDEKIRALLPAQLNRSLLSTWSCMGVSEAQLGEITEKALEGSGFVTGYRAHRPYIEVKVWVPQDLETSSASWFAKLEAAIGKWVVTRKGEDLAVRLLAQIKSAREAKNSPRNLPGNLNEGIDILEAGTQGALSERLGAILRKTENKDFAPEFTFASEWERPADPEHWMREVLSQATEDTTLAIAGPSANGVWHIGIKLGQNQSQANVTFPFSVAPLKSGALSGEFFDRSRSYAIEMAFQNWLSHLEAWAKV